MAITIANLQYASPDNVLIDMDVIGWQQHPTIPFTYHPEDTAPLTLEVKALLETGDYPIAPYDGPKKATPPPPDPYATLLARIEKLEKALKAKRTK